MNAPAARTAVRVDFEAERPQRRDVASTGRVPRVVRLLALAHRIDGMIRNGELDDLADAARRLNLTRARVTQIMNLLLLAPEIQEAILDLPLVTNGRDPITERQVRPIVAEADWNQQMEIWNGLCSLQSASQAF